MSGASAIISDCGKYRYRLERQCGADHLPAVAWIMVNPSTADANADDATIRKVIGFSARLGFGRVIVGNIFAYRATDIKELRGLCGKAAVGPENDMALADILADADAVIVAWGPLAKLGAHLRRDWRVIPAMADDMGIDLMCLGTAKDGQPLHPLMLAYDTPLQKWTAPDQSRTQEEG